MLYYLLLNLIYISILNLITNKGIVFGLRIGFKYQHNRQELEATKKVPIALNKCQNNSIQVFVHSAATSSGKYFERRQLTRQTWAKDALLHKFRVTFVLGQPKDSNTQNDIIDESNQFGDILQFGFIDDYHNLTLKAIAILRWTTINCMVGDYIIKTDDDILVNVERLKQIIERKLFLPGLTGKVIKNSKPVRNNQSEYAQKWLVPKEIYDKDVYPPYLSGSAYVMSIDVIEKLYESAVNNSGPIMDIDDLYLTGIIPFKFNIDLHNSPEFLLTNTVDKDSCGLQMCKLYTISTIHGCNSVNATLNLWNSWKNSTFDSCYERPETTTGKIAFIIAFGLMIIFFASILVIIFQYFSKNNASKWQKVNS